MFLFLHGSKWHGSSPDKGWLQMIYSLTYIFIEVPSRSYILGLYDNYPWQMPLSLNISPFKYLSSLEDYKEGMFDNSVNTTTSIQPVKVY